MVVVFKNIGIKHYLVANERIKTQSEEKKHANALCQKNIPEKKSDILVAT